MLSGLFNIILICPCCNLIFLDENQHLAPKENHCRGGDGGERVAVDTFQLVDFSRVGCTYIHCLTIETIDIQSKSLKNLIWDEIHEPIKQRSRGTESASLLLCYYVRSSL
jgi:hypothetical protein